MDKVSISRVSQEYGWYHRAEHAVASSVEYSLLTPNVEVDQTIVFYPGMACNRFGHPVAREPKNAVADLVEIASQNYNLIFPEVNMTGLHDDEPITGLTIDQQNQRLFEVLSHLRKKRELGRITYVGQSLGCLAVAQFVQFGGIADRERAVLWGPPTLEGTEHREMLVSKFRHKPGTRVNDEGEGQLEFGNDRIMYVSRDFWRSLDHNSLRLHHEAMTGHYESVVAICASRDDFYPNNEQYLEDYAPKVQRIEINGTNHMFRHDSMRAELKRIMSGIL